MSAAELLERIEKLPEDERRWLMGELRKIMEREDAGWARFSREQLARCYGPQDAIYDED